MAKVKVTICSSSAKSAAGYFVDLPKSTVFGSETIESSTTSQLLNIEGDPAKVRTVSTRFWCIVSQGWIHVSMGLNPEASEDDGWMIPPGVPTFFSIEENGERIAVKDA